jgi:hypothetical protein
VNFFAVDAYLTRLCSFLMYDIAGIGSAPPIRKGIGLKNIFAEVKYWPLFRFFAPLLLTPRILKFKIVVFCPNSNPTPI